MAKLSLKLLVDKEENRVVFAESDSDFVDIIFSFLTLPMGTIVRLLGKQSAVGCMDKLYESVDNLNTEYLQTDACKAMLLQPRGESEMACEDLSIKVDDLNPRRMYRCPKWDCFVTDTNNVVATVPGARCGCGQSMDVAVFDKSKGGGKGDGVFLKGAARFMISDDLHVTPVSTGAALSLLQSIGIRDADALEKMIVDVSRKEILSLLKRTLVSKTPLTDVFLTKQDTIENGTQDFKPAGRKLGRSKKYRVRLVENKSTNKLVYAEAGEELVDILFSFLTFPLGSIVKLLNKHSSLGCVDNLYMSLEVLSHYIKSDECKNMLLDPKLATHFGCTNQLLRIEEKLSGGLPVQGTCEVCYKEKKEVCSHTVNFLQQVEINPKLHIPGTESGGGFARRWVKFMVTDEMMVTLLSPIELQFPIDSLVEREITCGEAEVLNLLKACLISRTVLNDVFVPKKRRMPRFIDVCGLFLFVLNFFFWWKLSTFMQELDVVGNV